LLVDARDVDGFLRIHVVVDGVDHGLQHAVMMWLPPGVPTTMTGLPSLVTMVGLIEDSGRLLGAMALASPCTRPCRFGNSSFRPPAMRANRAARSR
jgi:hypothetical protein